MSLIPIQQITKSYNMDFSSQTNIQWEKINPLCQMMREVSLRTLPNVKMLNPIHDKNLPIMSESVNHNCNMDLRAMTH